LIATSRSSRASRAR